MENYPDIRHGDPATALIGMVIKQFDNILWAMNTRRFYTESSVDEHLQDIQVYFGILRCILYDLTTHRSALVDAKSNLEKLTNYIERG